MASRRRSNCDRLKVKVSIATEDATTPVDYIQGVAFQLFKKCDFVVENNSLLLSQSIQANYEDTVLEFQAVVRPNPITNRKFGSRQEVAKALTQRWCRESAMGLQGQARLEILNPDAYSLDCTPDHDGVDVRSLMLGSFVNRGLFAAQHYTKAIDFSRSQISGDHLLSSWAHFEHDRRLLVIHFVSNPEEALRNACAKGYKIEISYHSIQSILVDTEGASDSLIQDGNNNEDQPQRFLYLVLRWPPQVWEGIPLEPDRAGRREFLNLERCRDWVRAVGWHGCNKVLVAECPVLCLGMDKMEFMPLRQVTICGPAPDRLDQLMDIVGRFRSRCQMRTYFSPVCKLDGVTQSLPVIRRPMLTAPEPNEAGFRANYTIQALLSRGSVVKNQLRNDLVRCRSTAAGEFFERVKYCFTENQEATCEALEMLLAAIDEKKEMTLLYAFDILYSTRLTEHRRLEAGHEIEPYGPDVPPSCVLVRKVMVTPSRKLFLPREVMMSNRVLRKFGEDYAMRCVFRDDDGSKLGNSRMTRGRRADGRCGLLQELIRETLKEGIRVGDRHYSFLAWSNSQMRDQGCYLYSRTKYLDSKRKSYVEANAESIREWMGDFVNQTNVPKLMARMGQGLTQTQVSTPLTKDDWVVEPDVVGGDTGEYIFSDGVGRIRPAHAQEVARRLNLNPVPSAFQFRFKGMKGVLSVDKRLAQDPRGIKIAFRESQQKFEDPGDSCVNLEIVKHSMPSPVFLNRPLIMILDQVSEKQGTLIHRRVLNCVHAMLEQELFTMADMLCSEHKSATALYQRIPIKMHFQAMRRNGFSMTTEPFFRSLLLAIHRYNISYKQQLYKAKVEIPVNKGRTMYGILDETGTLQYGQVFVQYSTSINKPGTYEVEGSTTVILERKVLVTKNPCLPPGDVRIFEAVNVPELRHLVDVLVFPRYGRRPHPDEMAGSDLDGDEYSVFWEDNLMFERNEEPMVYPSNKPEPLGHKPNSDDMINFFVSYLSQDSIGMVSNAHLIAADRFSIFDQRCMDIALKCSVAVDFPKTGKPAPNLEFDERPNKYPDYMQKDHRPSYRSRRLIGQLYRKSKVVEDIIDLGQHSVKSHCDTHLCIDWKEIGPWSGMEWEELRKQAILTRDRYNSHIQLLLDNYGISDEASLVSGHMVTVKNRISDNEKEDFSYYNTEKLVELRYGRIFDNFRKTFFAEFGEDSDPLPPRTEENRDELPSYPEYMQQKAMLWYMVTYAPDGGNRTGLRSFPWLVWDILTYIKRNKVFANISSVQFDPLQQNLGEAIERAWHSDPQAAQERLDQLPQVDAVARYSNMYLDLNQLLAAVLRWTDREQVFTRSGLQQEHVCLLLLQFGLGLLGYAQDNDKPPIPYLTEETEDSQPRYLRHPEGEFDRKGAFLIDFLKYLASQKFFTLQKLDFKNLGHKGHLRRGEWRHLARVAFKTYHHIALTANFAALGLSVEQADALTERPIAFDWGEMESAVLVEMPLGSTDFHDGNVTDRLREWSGVDFLRVRRPNDRKHEQMLVSASGTLESRQRLQRILMADNLVEKLLENQIPAEAGEEMF